MAPTIRIARPVDFEAICSVDQIAQGGGSRQDRIRRGIEASEISVVVTGDSIAGYALLSYRFFGHGFIELVFIHPDHQGSGLGPLLITHLERICSDPKLFTTTNESNLRMQSVLARLGYERSGIIHNIDPGDPELVYFKKLRDL